MFNKRTLAVLKRELKTKLFSRTFILMTLLIPLFLFGIIGFQAFIMNYSGEEKINLVLITENDALSQSIKTDFDSLPFVKNGNIHFVYKTLNKNAVTQYLDENKQAMLSDKIAGAIFIPNDALKNKKVEYYSKSPKNFQLFERLKGPLNDVLLQSYFADKELTNDEINFVKEKVDFSGYRISSGKQITEEGVGNTIVSYLFSFLLYFSLIMSGTLMMRAVVEEKNNRIVEVLLSSVNSTELMTGKILGASITGLLQMAIWMLPLIFLISTTIFMLPPEYAITLSLWQMSYFLLNFFIALITFMGLFASVGAIFDNDQDAQSGMWPILIIIMIPFFIAMGMQTNPDNMIARIGSMFPFASLIIMPSRMVLIDVPIWQFLFSVFVNIATMLILFPLAGKIYRTGILMTGKKPSWGEVVKWLKI